MNISKRLAPLVLLMLLSGSKVAEAHIIAARLGDFYTGALHPLTDLQDIVLWLALGLFAGSLGPERGRWLVPVMPLGLLAGFSAELSFGVGAVGPLGNAALMVCVGLVLAAGLRLTTPMLCLLAFGLAFTRGAANADAVVTETNRVLFAAGLALAGYVAITLVMALTIAFRRAEFGPRGDWKAIALRVCGSWIAAVGLMIGGFALKSAAT